MDNKIENKKLIILLIVCILYSFVFAFVLSRQSSLIIRSDFFTRWYATEKLLSEGRSIYDPLNGEEVVSLQVLWYDQIEGSFFYPPYLLIFTLPLGFFSYSIAHFIWLIFVQLSLILSIWLMRGLMNWPKTTNSFTVFVFLSLFFIPTLQLTIWGQFNGIGILGLVLAYRSLQRQQYRSAGFWTLGLIMKPQNMTFTVAFLLIWAASKRERWPFIKSFMIGAIAFWGFAEIFEPNWMTSFIKGVQGYSGYLQPLPVIEKLSGIDNIIPSFVLIFITLIVFIIKRDFNPGSTVFAGMVLLSMGIWWMVVPVLGMFHLVALPAAMILLVSAIETHNPKHAILFIRSYIFLFIIGLVGFIYGLSAPDLYGLHIALAEGAYKIAGVILLTTGAFYLCFSPNKLLIEKSN